MVVYECEYMVDSRDIDPWYHCRPSGLMGMLQEAATQAACALHVSRDEMLERYNSFWMLARLWYRLDSPTDEKVNKKMNILPIEINQDNN